MHTDIHALSGIRTHDPSVRAGEDGACLRPSGHVIGPKYVYTNIYSGHNFLRLYTVKFIDVTNEHALFVFDLEDGGSVFLRNISIILIDCMPYTFYVHSRLSFLRQVFTNLHLQISNGLLLSDRNGVQEPAFVTIRFLETTK
jgi:hypothetical protein